MPKANVEDSHEDDHHWKSTADLVRKLCDIAHKGGNFLLNVGPTAEGEIPAPSIERLEQAGDWMKANGKSIYGTTKSPYKKLPFNGRCTVKGNRLFLQVFEWPAGGLKLDGLLTPVKGVRALAGGARLKWAMEPAAESDAPRVLAIAQPARLDPIATVIEVTLAGPPNVTDVGAARRAGADGSFILKATDAEVQGQTANYEQGEGRDNIGFWINKDDYVTWMCDVANPGRYRVEINYACPEGTAGSQYTVGVDKGASAGGAVKATGSWVKFESETIGSFDLPAGRQTIAVHAQGRGDEPAPGAVGSGEIETPILIQCGRRHTVNFQR